jgi:hypothetical protein
MKIRIVLLILAALIVACAKNPSNSGTDKTIPLGNWKQTYAALVVHGVNDTLVLNRSIYMDTNHAIEGFMKINDSDIVKYLVKDSCYYVTTMPYTADNFLHFMTWTWSAPSSFIRGVTEVGNGLYASADSIFLYDTVTYDNMAADYAFGYRKSYDIVKFVRSNIEMPNSSWPAKTCN